MNDTLLHHFFEFGMAGLIGFAHGLERDMAGSSNPHAGSRDFILIALLGAVSGFLTQTFDSPWVIIPGFFGIVAFLLSGYWFDRKRDTGITTEMAAILTYFLGVLVVLNAMELAIALSIVTLVILSQKQAIQTITSKIQLYELQAAIKFLVISFIILPVFPNQPLSDYLLTPLGSVLSYEAASGNMEFSPEETLAVEHGGEFKLYSATGTEIGLLKVTSKAPDRIAGTLALTGKTKPVGGEALRQAMGADWLYILLGALNPYKIWLIVVLVSFISFVGYIAVKILGAGAGIGLTGLIGGLASSTVTTVSFAKRSIETPAFNRSFAVAILLASAIMFPRLLLEIAVVNQQLMKNMALPVIAMGVTGVALALFFTLNKKGASTGGDNTMQLSNPFCLKSAIAFGLVFSIILILTRMATIYLGDAWLPVVAIVSGLVDVDAIAFSLSDAQKAGIISLDWASFNLVLGAVSNTLVKLFYIFTLGTRQLFRQLTVSFLIVSIVGLISIFIYYDV